VLGAAGLAHAQAPDAAKSGDDNAARVFITDRGGARAQTAEIIKTFNERCPELTVTTRKASADYVVLLEHEARKGAIRVDNKVAVFAKNGDAILSGSARILGNAVKDACDAIRRELATHN
jgi:hypothetical protein